MRKTASATPKWIKNNTEVEEFYNDSEYTNVIYNACWKNGLDRSRWDEVRNTVAIKFGQGKLKYGPHTRRNTYDLHLHGRRKCRIKSVKIPAQRSLPG